MSFKSKDNEMYQRHHYIPCSKQDYDQAMHNEVPDRWWQYYQNLCENNNVFQKFKIMAICLRLCHNFYQDYSREKKPNCCMTSYLLEF